MKVFDKYEVVRRIAVGGMGEIFLAKQADLVGFDRFVILKSLLPGIAKGHDAVQWFLDEARVVSKLNHPNIVSVFEVGLWENTYYIAMEYIRGVSLSELLEHVSEHGVKIPLGIVCAVVRDVAKGLHHAHTAKDINGTALSVVHRDVSPHNVMVRYDGVVKVVDFGIARATNRTVRTETGLIKGKLPYMAPEQVRGGELDHRSDQFSL
ncbi:MAG: serine/threonine-protein kinase, partial [Myxococcota bacterium]